MSDWADEKAVETLKIILSPIVTLDQAVEFMAATFRLVESTGAKRGIDELSERLDARSAAS